MGDYETRGQEVSWGGFDIIIANHIIWCFAVIAWSPIAYINCMSKVPMTWARCRNICHGSPSKTLGTVWYSYAFICTILKESERRT